MVVNLSVLDSTSNPILIRADLIPDTSYADFGLGNSSSKFVAGYFEEGHFDYLKIKDIPLSNFIRYKSGTATATTRWKADGQGTSDSPFVWMHDKTTYSGLPSSLAIVERRISNDTSGYNTLVATFLLLSATNIQMSRQIGTNYLNFTSSVRAEEPSSSPDAYGQTSETRTTFSWNYIAIC